MRIDELSGADLLDRLVKAGVDATASQFYVDNPDHEDWAFRLPTVLGLEPAAGD